MLEQINIRVFVAINKYAGSSPFVDHTMVVVAEYLPFLFIAVLTYLWFSSDIKRKYCTLYAGYSVVVGLTINHLIALFYFHPRPFMENIGTALVEHATETSFPSDHATFMLSSAGMLFFFKPTRKIGSILFVIGLFGGASRIFCGVHFPLDILGSVMISLVASTLIFALKERFMKLNESIICNIHKYRK